MRRRIGRLYRRGGPMVRGDGEGRRSGVRRMGSPIRKTRRWESWVAQGHCTRVVVVDPHALGLEVEEAVEVGPELHVGCAIQGCMLRRMGVQRRRTRG